MRKYLKIMLWISVMLLLLHGSPCAVMADEVVPEEGFKVEWPMETGAVGFWFPETGAFAAGISHTVLRVSHSEIPRLSIDLDATIAQEVTKNNDTDDQDTLGGVGVKLNFDIAKMSEKTGFVFLPSIGLTALNNFAEFKKMQDILDNYTIAVYGTILLYKW